MANRIQIRGDLANVWTTVNPVLADREMALETDTDKFKIGDGVRAWNDLPYGGIKGDKGDTGSVENLSETLNIEDSESLCDPIGIGDEIFLGGHPSEGITNKGRRPIFFSSDFVPATDELDGVEYDRSERLFANRGVHGFFGEYRNEIQYSTVNIESYASISDEGDWKKLTATADGSGSAGLNYGFETALSNYHVHTIVRKGKISDNHTYWYMINNGGEGNPSIHIYWDGSKTVVAALSTVKYSFIDDDTVIIDWYVSSSTSGPYPTLSLNIYTWNDSTNGDYIYFKDLMVVDLPYPVPYVKGKHISTYGKYNFDWSSSDAWTIEGWFYPLVVSSKIMDIGDYYSPSALLLTVTSAGALGVYVKDSSGNTSSRSKMDGLNTWSHIQIIFSDTYVKVRIDGGALVTTKYFPKLEDIEKILSIGSNRQYGFPSPSWCHIAELVIKPYADESTTHYQTGKPYYDPDITYGVNGIFSISKRGDMTVRSLSTMLDDGSGIYDQYTEGDETVIKYNSGLMVQFGPFSDVSDINTAYSTIYRSAQRTHLHIEEFSESPIVFYTLKQLNGSVSIIGGTSSTSNRKFHYISMVSVAGVVMTYEYLAIGRYK